MKTLLKFLFFFLLASPCFAQYQARITLESGEVVSGEVVHEYDSRWFWETVGERWLALLPEGGSVDDLRMISGDEVKKIEKLGPAEFRFQEGMNAKGFELQRLPLDGPVFVSTGNDGHHLQEKMYGDFAWDLEVKNQEKTHSGQPTVVENYFIWNKEVLSPVDGTIEDLYRVAPDNQADPSLKGDLSNKGDGNFILIRLSPFYYVLMTHFMKDSIGENLKIGDPVKVGDVLGKVGNSGRTYVPHLHLTTYFYSSELKRMISVPNSFNGYQPKTGEILEDPLMRAHCGRFFPY